MALINKTAAAFYPSGNAQFPETRCCVFDVDAPVSAMTAWAHLRVSDPRGCVVCIRGRGPRGGLIKLRFVHSGEQMPPQAERMQWFIVVDYARNRSALEARSTLFS
jgi:hypothetical protein